ncbi:hypothetical protein FRE64_04480 [Euhalothece natronophila Z-M001]|uniref:Uncharacterized protein n=1 Tax=Euhalothece natronophila Z-M001 TaxID=522448 RepID=A0A5B8NJ14_9CHRO|nr:hypothetical protein [Euhalothece natronophila]QDZ39253.1 hypothetical protein FRE64_04480 [Euhalothece natronophila Z-M001]
MGGAIAVLRRFQKWHHLRRKYNQKKAEHYLIFDRDRACQSLSYEENQNDAKVVGLKRNDRAFKINIAG